MRDPVAQSIWESSCGVGDQVLARHTRHFGAIQDKMVGDITPMPVQAPRRLFSVDEFHQMADAGIFREDDHVELLAGEIVQMTPIGSRHAACVSRLNRLLHERLGHECIVRVQDPIRLDDYSEPQPDVAVVKPRGDFYSGAHPTAADVLLVIEVADTSAEADRSEKAPLYARSRIPETWIVDLDGRVVDVYNRPDMNVYQQHQRFGPEDHISPVNVPALTLSVADVVG
jgi:Uma2 family endonuclease